MRTCEKCGKANKPTRKYCIRCGGSLMKRSRKKASAAPPAKGKTPERDRVITGKKKTKAEATDLPTDDVSTTTDDEWVRPSEVRRDRVRTASGTKRKTEMEKAMEAFERADEVGIDEEGTGVVETRMLRASEVRELLEGPTEMEPVETPTPHTAPTADESPTEEVVEAIEPPTQEQIEEQILGTHSALVSSEESVSSESPPIEDTEAGVSASISEEFTFSRYESEAPPPIAAPAVDVEIDRPTPCPKCGALITLDDFDYPPEVYSAMGQARLKQARFFVVQAKYDKAQDIVRIARSLFQKAGDLEGIEELDTLAGSIASRG